MENSAKTINRPTIPHFKPIVMGNKFLGQGRGSFKDLPRTFFLKSTLFTNKRPVPSPDKLGFCPSRINMLSVRAFKCGIVGLFNTFSF